MATLLNTLVLEATLQLTARLFYRAKVVFFDISTAMHYLLLGSCSSAGDLISYLLFRNFSLCGSGLAFKRRRQSVWAHFDSTRLKRFTTTTTNFLLFVCRRSLDDQLEELQTLTCSNVKPKFWLPKSEYMAATEDAIPLTVNLNEPPFPDGVMVPRATMAAQQQLTDLAYVLVPYRWTRVVSNDSTSVYYITPSGRALLNTREAENYIASDRH